jgi:hypothetical protein
MATGEAIFSQALNHWQHGLLADAENLCRKLIATDPTYAPAWHLLGHLAFEANDGQLAQECLARPRP